MTGKKIKVVSYERVSTEKQAERASILAQADALDAHLKGDPHRDFISRYQDEAFSGALALHDRPAGKRLLEDAARGLFDEVWVFKTDRLGRDDIDPHVVRRTLSRYGVKLCSLHDNIDNPLFFAIKVAFDAEERRTIQLRTRAGMKAASRRGRYLGGPPPYGYRVEEREGHPYLVPDNEVVFGDCTAADIVRNLFNYVALERRSARSIAKELNSLGVPTSYARMSRGVRGQRTRNVWTPGRILQILKNTTYKGQPTWGKRPKDKYNPSDVSVGNCPALVSEELWAAAQEALAANRLIPKNTKYVALLRSVIKCGICGLTFCTSQGRGDIRWYRCNGYLAERGGKDHRCTAKMLKSTVIDPLVWNDIERILRNATDIVEELAAERSQEGLRAVTAAQRITYQAALNQLDTRKQNVLDMREHGRIDDRQLEDRLSRIANERAEIEERLAACVDAEDEDHINPELLAAIRERLDAGLTDVQRQQIAQVLVKRITVNTILKENGKKDANVVIEYRFPSAGVVSTETGTGSSLPPA